MAAGDVAGTKPCRCGGLMTFKEGKSGAISGACDSCKRQTFDRSPAAVNALKAQLERAGGKGEDKGGEKKSAGALGEAFDLSKL